MIYGVFALSAEHCLASSRDSNIISIACFIVRLQKAFDFVIRNL